MFSYLVLFRPRILLIDEPECHLHPTLQTKLIGSLQKRVKENNPVVLATTHSPFVARGLPIGSRTVWLDRGGVVATTQDETIRDALGWGALDKSVMLCSEDSRMTFLNEILDQDENLRCKVAIFPFDEVSKLGSGAALVRLKKALGNHHRIVIHRDRDCMTDSELEPWKMEYSKPGLDPWVTFGSDMEMYFCEPDAMAAALDISSSEATIWIDEVFAENEEAFKSTFAKKRAEINKKLYEKSGGSPSTEDLWDTMPLTRKVKGKDLLPKLRERARASGFDEKKIGRSRGAYVAGSDLIAFLANIL
ncbi:MAG: AAA family ATPase [Rhodanobacteraceae bacterium]